MALGCKLCIAEHGLKGSELASLPQTVEDFEEHLRVVHGLTVVDRQKVREELAATRRLGPGIYHDDQGYVHVSACELLAYLGIPHTLQTEQLVLDALREVSRKSGLREPEEVVVIGD